MASIEDYKSSAIAINKSNRSKYDNNLHNTTTTTTIFHERPTKKNIDNDTPSRARPARNASNRHMNYNASDNNEIEVLIASVDNYKAAAVKRYTSSKHEEDLLTTTNTTTTTHEKSTKKLINDDVPSSGRTQPPGNHRNSAWITTQATTMNLYCITPIL